MLLLVLILVVKGNEAYNMFEGDLVIQFLSNIYFRKTMSLQLWMSAY